MKRLLLEGDCTVLERSLLSSVDLDVPPPRALEKLRVAIERQEETAVIPAVAADREERRLRRGAIGLAFGIAAGIALFLIARHDHKEAMRPDPSLPMTTAAPPAPVAPAPVESASESQAGMQATPPPVPCAPSPPVAVPPTPPTPPTPRTPPSLPSAPTVKRVSPLASAFGPMKTLTPPQPTSVAQSFDKGAAAGALGRVDLTDCKAIPGPDGSGHVTVTFALDGTVQSAVVDQGPYPGTARGGCIAGKFRQVVIPPFDGSPVRVGKSFTLP